MDLGSITVRYYKSEGGDGINSTVPEFLTYLRGAEPLNFFTYNTPDGAKVTAMKQPTLDNYKIMKMPIEIPGGPAPRPIWVHALSRSQIAGVLSSSLQKGGFRKSKMRKTRRSRKARRRTRRS